MPMQQRESEKVEDGKDWVRFKFPPDLWQNFLRKCVAGGKDIDDIIGQLISGWCWVVNQQTSESGWQDKDRLEKEFALLCEDLNRSTLHYVKRDELVRRAVEIRNQLDALGKIQ